MVFQSAPDLIRWLVKPSPGLESSHGAIPLELDRQYRFSAPEIKAGSHRLIEHWRVVVITPHQRLQLGPVLPLRDFLAQVHWVSLEDLGQLKNLDAAVDLLTLPVRSEQELGGRCRRTLASRRDLEPVVFSMLLERFPKPNKEEILMIAGVPLQELRHTRAVQEILKEGRQEGMVVGLETGRQQEAAALAVRLLTRRLGTLDAGTRELLVDLHLQQLERLAEDLLDFTEPGDLQAWFDDHPAG